MKLAINLYSFAIYIQLHGERIIEDARKKQADQKEPGKVPAEPGCV